MSFRVLGLSPDPFRPLFALSDAELLQRGIRRVIPDNPLLPCDAARKSSLPQFVKTRAPTEAGAPALTYPGVSFTGTSGSRDYFP
jgi:hypothetical protein